METLESKIGGGSSKEKKSGVAVGKGIGRRSSVTFYDGKKRDRSHRKDPETGEGGTKSGSKEVAFVLGSLEERCLGPGKEVRSGYSGGGVGKERRLLLGRRRNRNEKEGGIPRR